MDIEGLGDKMVGLLLENGVVKSLPDIYELAVEKLHELPRMGQLSSSNLVQAIEESKKRPLSRFIFALGIRHVGTKTATVIARNCHTIETFLTLTEDVLVDIEEIGPETARSVAEFLGNEDERKLVERLLQLGVAPEAQQGVVADGSFQGKTFVLTGALATLSRKEAEELVISNGGTVSSSVSKKTSYVVAGESPGSKLDAARKYGVMILSEEKFKDLLKA